MARLKRFRKRIKNWFIYIFVKFGYTFLNSTKRITAFKLFKTMAAIGYHVVPSEREKTIAHLTKVFGNQYSQDKIREMAKEVFINLGRNMVDAFRISQLNPENIDQLVRSTGLEKIDEVLERGKGCLLLTGHVGNWELLGAYVSLKGYPLHVIGAPIYDRRLDEMVVNNRKASGARYIARGSATRQIIRALRHNETIGILIDQDTKKVDGELVDFLGHKAYTPVGPVEIAHKFKCPLLPIAIHIQKDNTHFVEVGDEIKLQWTDDHEHDRIENTQRCSKAIEHFILKNPTQWVWMHKRWRTQKKPVINKAK
ncbi:hypothetical protein GF337_12110 [candidate division KSB1 bacterium]|nr:hypothetical protein [candidate division KSB1 bacterium]